MQYGWFIAKFDDFCPMIFSDYRIFIAQSRHIAYTMDVSRQFGETLKNNVKLK
jgi:hypothetical protein